VVEDLQDSDSPKMAPTQTFFLYDRLSALLRVMGRIRESAFGTIDVPIVERSHGPMNEEVIFHSGNEQRGDEGQNSVGPKS
jgi:hypothetical protein